MPEANLQGQPFDGMIAAVAARPLPEGADWLAGLRDRAERRYARVGWPHGRTEAWKYTSLNALAAAGFSLATASPRSVPRERILPLDAARIVLVNGVLQPQLSDLDDLPSGLRLIRLADGDPRLRETAARLIDESASTDGFPLATLNTATFVDAIMLDIADRARVEDPVHIVSLAGPAPGGFAPRIMIHAGRDSMANVVESHAGDSSGGYFSNAVTQVSVAPGAMLGHYKFQNEDADAFHVALSLVDVAEAAIYDNFALSMGARLSRNEIRGRIDGANVEYCINGAYVGRDRQHLDHTTFIEHAAAGSRSREVYKGVLTDYARGVFQGKILVRQDAQQTDGYQMNRAMLLSERAEIDSKPELEIYADDVRCSHGATIGAVQEDQLFYLQARGLPHDVARRILVGAFLDDAIDEIRADRLREVLKQPVADWLSQHLAGDGQ